MIRALRHRTPLRYGRREVCVAAFLLVAATSAAGEVRPDSSAEEIAFFEQEVLPILRERCFSCHGAGERLKSGFRITSRAGLIRGGTRGPAIDLEDPAASRILEMISYRDADHEMPPDAKLPAEAISVLERWVALGAPYDPKHEIEGGSEASSEFPANEVNDRTKNYWAFRPLAASEVPRVDSTAWQGHPVDAFIYSRLARHGLRPNGLAPRRQLIRRAYHDLIGLPPTPDEVRAFVEDPADEAEAFEKVIDHLLDSPHYGERWGRHWLDLVRYAESNGYERDSVKPEAWRYRDYVISSLNDDKPYDRFILEQLAGDELDEPTADSITATGYYRLGLWDDEPADPLLARYDYLDSIVSTTGEVMLGLTIGCARCHEHKIDPIPAADYYRLLAFFQNLTPHGKGDRNLVTVATEAERRRFQQEVREKEAYEDGLHAALYAIEQEFLTAAAKRLSRLRAGSVLTSDLVDLRYRFYRDSWETLPEFDELRPEAEGRIGHNFFSLRPASRPDAMGLVFEGRLRVPQDGDYAFELDCSDGARLRVAGATVVEAGTGADAGEASSSVSLTKGYHPIRLDFYNRDGNPRLDLRWSGPGFSRRSLTIEEAKDTVVLLDDARKGAQTWLYTFEKPTGNWQAIDYDASGWRRGPGGFGVKGTPGAVVRTEWKTRHIWLRRRFELRGGVRDLQLLVHHDEDAEIYLNGRLVKKLVGFKTNYTSLSLGEAGKRALREGENWLAVHCLNRSRNQYIDLGLVDAGGTVLVADQIAANGAEVLGQEERDRYFVLQTQLDESRKRKLVFEETKVMAVAERGEQRTFVLRRGNPRLRGEEVEPGFPSVLEPPEPLIERRGDSSGRRRALAEWVVDPANPLASRVVVNRVWQHHFGRGIVRSSNNFGHSGAEPTHPLLLDWLAREFQRCGWRLKPFHKMLMLSRAYRMSSLPRAGPMAEDPTNDLCWRFDMRRLSAEEIRDSMLAVTGELNRAVGGPSIYSELPPEVLATSSTGAQKWGKSSPEERRRRSVYIFVRRSLQDPMLTNFDFADTDSSCAVRFSTIVPTQALTLLNSHFVNERASAFAARLRRECGDDVRPQVARAFELAVCREATADEVADGVELIRRFEEAGAGGPSIALERFCLLILNLNEFLFVD